MFANARATHLVIPPVLAAALLAASLAAGAPRAQPSAKRLLGRLELDRGVCVVLSDSAPGVPEFVLGLVRNSDLLVYFQSPREQDVAAVRSAALEAGLLGKRVFAGRGALSTIQLADNMAGAVVVTASQQGHVGEQELLRVLHPGGKAMVGERTIEKPFPAGCDQWTHPYHTPDNNPQSTDRLARAPYLTQFLARPQFVPMPEVSVAAGGRVFRAFGHIAHKANQNPMLNTLLCYNAFNGTILWRRPLREGFMIHRNTMIATPETLYLADDQSCKLIDPRTGRDRGEIVVPAGLADGPVWKWMALEDGILYTLVGGEEVRPATVRSNTPGMGHWPWGMWEGHDYANPKTNFGFGRTFVAFDPASKKPIWSHREEEFVDSRGVCMKSGRIYYYSPEKFLACLDAKTGKPAWKNSDADLLAAIGPPGRAQLWVTGYSTTTYIKCNDEYVLFAGPQRSKLVVASAKDGKLLWKREGGNYQLVLQRDGFYAAGPLRRPDRPAVEGAGFKLAYATGDVLAELPVPGRRACTRATGSIDSIFFRAPGGTVRIETATNTARHIAPMRPPCQDGVIISDGHLYWGPWMCGCQLSFYGHVGLAPAGDFDYHPPIDDSRLETPADDPAIEKPLAVADGDWPAYLGNNRRSPVTPVAIPRAVKRQWTFRSPTGTRPTAPVAAGGLVFFGDRSGVVRAFDAATGKPEWQALTGGAIFFPPAIEDGRAFVGSADGRVYAFEAATGRPLWTFRLAPAQERINVFDELICRWPVAGGVVAQDGVVYAAAGMAHYDGTYVVALDAATGRVKWANDRSGTLSEKAQSGASLQGGLYIEGAELRFAGGGVCHVARFDLATGKCLCEPHHEPNSFSRTAFYPYYPKYGRYLPLNHQLPDGSTLVYGATYDGAGHRNLSRRAPGSPAPPFDPREPLTLGRPPSGGPKPLWTDAKGRRFTAFVVGPGLLLAAGHMGALEPSKPQLAAITLADGTDAWSVPLDSLVVKGGLAVDAAARVFVSLEDGRVVCLGKQ